MKIKFLFAFIFLLGVSFKGFSQTAGFTMDVSSGCAPLCVNFMDQSTNPVAWSWDFGDASAPSNVQFPTHCYATSGVYTVTLTVTFASSTGTATGTITVYPNPVAAFSFVNAGNNTVNFTDQSTGATTWYWIFGDNTFSTAQNPSHPYATSGNYTVCLGVVSAMGCADTTCMSVQPTGIANFEKTNWNLFPNPSSNGIFTVQFDSEKTELLVIENVLGEKILSQEISKNTTVNLSNQPAGTYFVRVGNGPAQKLVIAN